MSTTLRSATIRLAYQVPALRPHLMSVLAASVADEIVEAFWDAIFDDPTQDTVVTHSAPDDFSWSGEAIGGYGHGDNWSPTEYAEGETRVKVPTEIRYTARVQLDLNLPVSPAEVERILENAIRRDGPERFTEMDTVRDDVLDALSHEPTLNTDRWAHFAIVEKCVPQLEVREVTGGFSVDIQIMMGVAVDHDLVEVDAPEDSDPREGDGDDGDGDWQGAQDSWERERGY